MANVQVSFEELKAIVGSLYVENTMLERRVNALTEALRAAQAPAPIAEVPKPTRRKAGA